MPFHGTIGRAGNRQINRTLHIMATVQLQQPDRRPGLLRPEEASGKTSMGSMRCLKRRLSDIVYQHMVDDAVRAMTGPGGHRGAAKESSATGSHPHTGSSDKSLPGPATAKPTTALPAAS